MKSSTKQSSDMTCGISLTPWALCAMVLGSVVAASGASAQELVYVSIPVGTPVPVVTNVELSSKTAKKGDKLNLTVKDSVVIGGRTVIAKDAPIWGTVLEAKKSGRFGHNGELNISVDSVKLVDGHVVALLADLTGENPNANAAQGQAQKPSNASVSGIPGADIATGFFKRGGDIEIDSNEVVPIFTATYVVLQFTDSSAASTQSDEPASASEPTTTSDSSAPVADSTPSDDSVATDDSSATASNADSPAEAESSSAEVLEPALALFEGVETWARALGAYAAHLGSTPQVRALGARMVQEHSVLQAEGAKFAASKKIPVMPLVPGDQENLSTVLASMRALKGADFDQAVLQRIYGIGQNVINTFADGHADMKPLLEKTVTAWGQHMTEASKLMTKK